MTFSLAPPALAYAATKSAWLETRLMPTLEPSSAGLTANDDAPKRVTSASNDVDSSITISGCTGSPSAAHSRLVNTLSMAIAQAATPAPV